MIDGLKPYPAMKPSGCAWLGDIPSHWSMRRNGGLFSQRVEHGGQGLPILEVSIKMGVRVRNMDGTGRKQAMSDHGKYKCARRGDIAYNTMRMWQGAVGVSPTDGLISPAYVIARPLDGVVPGYYANLFKTPMFMKEVIDCSRGIVMDRNRLYWDQFKQIAVPVIGLDEQTMVVRYLNHATGGIDRAILEQKRASQLLQEHLSAITSRLLFPSASHLSALAGTKRIKHILKERDERSALGEETHLSMSQRKGLVPAGQVDRAAMLSASYAGGKLCRKGDLVLNRLKAHLGVFAVASQDGVISPDYSVFHPVSNYNTDYLRAVLRSAPYRRELAIRCRGIVEGFWRLYTDDFYCIRVPDIPISEQASVLEKIQGATTEIQAAIESHNRIAGILLEQRKVLIADVVTGKLDVRAVAASLPADELVPIALDADGDDLDTDEDADA